MFKLIFNLFPVLVAISPNMESGTSSISGDFLFMEKINVLKLVGTKNNMLTVIGESDFKSERNKHRKIKVLCDCGKISEVYLGNWKEGKSKSCGCLRERVMHGRDHKLYKVWTGIKQRCYNPKSAFYKFYGGRGIKVCEKWLIYDNFYDDNIGRYIDGYEIDRYPDINGDYSLENTRIVPHVINSQNTRRTKLSLEIASEIRKSSKNTKELSIKYNCGMEAIRQVLRNIRWKEA